MKKIDVLLEERKMQYETTLNLINNPTLNQYLKTMGIEEREDFLRELDLEGETAEKKLNNPDSIREEIKKELPLDAIKFLDSMKYIVENSIDLSELINRAPKNWLHSDELSKEEKIVLFGYQIGLTTFGYNQDDYKECGGYTDPNFLKKLANKISNEFGITIPLSDELLTINVNNTRDIGFKK